MNAGTATLTFETERALFLTVGGNRLGKRARTPEALIMFLQICDGGSVKTSSFGSFRKWVQVDTVTSGVRQSRVCVLPGVFSS